MQKYPPNQKFLITLSFEIRVLCLIKSSIERDLFVRNTLYIKHKHHSSDSYKLVQ